VLYNLLLTINLDPIICRRKGYIVFEEMFNDMERVGFIGLGKMGYRMASNIIKKFPLIVWNRTIERADELSAKGATVASSPSELAKQSTVIITMLATPTATADVILGREQYKGRGVLDGVSDGKIIIDMSTNSPLIVRMIASHLIGKGCYLIDAPVMGSIQAAEEAALTILASGEFSAFEKIKPILETMGKKVWYLGELGKASSLKLIFNLHLFLLTAAFSEAFALAIRSKLDPKTVLEIWNSSNQKTYISETKGPRILADDWTATFTVGLALKDLQILAEMVEELEFPLILGSVVRELYKACSSLDLKEMDFAAIYKLYEYLSKARKL
jgi:3-hydroxyisobutyrate dehydrogenase-like beta-hydroxyacid dehydrogenase